MRGGERERKGAKHKIKKHKEQKEKMCGRDTTIEVHTTAMD